MSKVLLHLKRWVLIAAVCVFACVMTGCVESTFNLANESRLPHGVAIPPGLTRDDVFVTLDYFEISKAKFTLRDKNGRKLATVIGKTEGAPIDLGPNPGDPGYQLVVIDGVTEIIECIPYRDHANMAQNGHIVALFKVVDDPALTKQLLAIKGLH